jgi:hypothetical protein
LEQCEVCGRFWFVEYPFSERHGGGPPCAYHTDRRELASQHLTADIRQRSEDAVFFCNLGPEVGPERCRAGGCDRLRVHNSVFCARHHFESVKGYSFTKTAGDNAQMQRTRLGQKSLKKGSS